MSQFVQSRTMNTLAREGINPSRATAVVGSTFGQPGVSKTNDQQRVADSFSDKRIARNMSEPSRLPVSRNYLPHKQWISLGDGWFQTTVEGSGSSARCGLHSLIESSPSDLFMCIYEPRTREAYMACTSSVPEFNLEVSTKLVLSRLPGSRADPRCSYQVVVAFKSPVDYVALSCNIFSKQWTVNRVREDSEQVLQFANDPDLKANVFYGILVQIRGGCLSIDINGAPTFTALRLTDGDTYAGLVGLVAKCSKFAIKGWKIKGVGVSSGSSVGGRSFASADLAPPSPNRETSPGSSTAGSRAGQANRRPVSAAPFPGYKPTSMAQGMGMGMGMGGDYMRDGDYSDLYSVSSAASASSSISASASASASQSRSAVMSLAEALSNVSSGQASKRPTSASLTRSAISPPHSARDEGIAARAAAAAYASTGPGGGVGSSGSSGASLGAGSRPGSSQSLLGRSFGASAGIATGGLGGGGGGGGGPVPPLLPPSRANYAPASGGGLGGADRSGSNPRSKVRSLSASAAGRRSQMSHSGEGGRGEEDSSWLHGDSASIASSSSSSHSQSRMTHPFTRLGPALVSAGGGGPGGANGIAWAQQHPDEDADEDADAEQDMDTPTNTPSRGEGRVAVQSERQKERVLYECSNILKERHEQFVVDMVMRDVIQLDIGITFDDIAALTTAKRLLHEAVLLPLLMPEFFTGIREPWKGVLLFGPPGTGKTMLAKAVCGFNSSTFFSCSSSSLISKFRGESEKIVRCLFEAARLCTPSVVFLDEVDALVSARGADGEHEASRRLKTEFFAQMDGITAGSSSSGSGQGVMVLATTNCPWDLDEAMRRRLEKRIHIPLPGPEARKEQFKICLKDLPVSSDVSISLLSNLTDGYSGADIHVACREASMMPMRRLIAIMSPHELSDMRRQGQLVIPKVTMADFQEAISNTRPSISKKMVDRFLAWEKEFGSY